MKTYAVLIPSWNAVIPKDWALEIKTVASGEWEPVAGKEILVGQGDEMRGGPETLMAGMLAQGFVREVI